MASIRKQKGRFGTRYNAEVYVKGRRLSATFDTLSEAARWAEETEGLLRAGLPLPGEVPVGDMDFVAAVEKYTMAVAKQKKANTRRLDQEIGKRLISFFSGKTMQTIAPKDIAEYRDWRMQSVGPSSVIQDMSFVSCLYRMARAEWGLHVEDPGKEIRRPSAPKHRLSLLTPEQIDKLLDYCCISKSELLYSYVLLMLHTAMRPSEAAGMKWSNVHFDRHIIDLTETKTDPRRVPLTKVAEEALMKVKAYTGENAHVFIPDNYSDLARPSRFFRRSFENACRYAEIDGFVMYGLRHSAASYLIMHGVDIRTVAEIMGHRNISQTMRYTHFLDAHRIEAIQVLGKIGR